MDETTNVDLRRSFSSFNTAEDYSLVVHYQSISRATGLLAALLTGSGSADTGRVELPPKAPDNRGLLPSGIQHPAHFSSSPAYGGKKAPHSAGLGILMDLLYSGITPTDSRDPRTLRGAIHSVSAG